jgi:hypothetical protein
MTLPHAINAANVQMRFPSLRSTPPAMIEFAIEEADLRCDEDILGSFYLPAFLYLTAHIITRALQAIETGSGQVLRSVSVGGEISYSYANPTEPSLNSPSDLADTVYGARYLEYLQLAQPAVAII